QGARILSQGESRLRGNGNSSLMNRVIANCYLEVPVRIRSAILKSGQFFFFAQPLVPSSGFGPGTFTIADVRSAGIAGCRRRKHAILRRLFLQPDQYRERQLVLRRME